MMIYMLYIMEGQLSLGSIPRVIEKRVGNKERGGKDQRRERKRNN